MSLLDKAKSVAGRTNASRIEADDSELLELFVAWAHGEVSTNQVALTLGCSTQGVATKAGAVIRNGCIAGDLKLSVRK